MKAAAWIDRVKTAHHWESDYRVSKELGLSRNTISNYRAGRSDTMDDDTAVKVATALGAAPELVLIDQAVERSKSEAARTALGAALRRLGGVAASVAMAAGIGVSVGSPSPANASTGAASGPSLYIMSSARKRRRSPFAVMADTLAGMALLPA